MTAAAEPHPPQLAEFVALYRAGRFFDAHEVLEEVWRRSEEPPMRFLQGLIQWAVAFEHHRRGNAHGARVLLDRAWSRLKDSPDGYMGLDLTAWRAARPALADAFARWELGGPRPEVEAPPIAGAGVGWGATPPGRRGRRERPAGGGG
jgi:uncharacterized protein